MKKGQFSKFIIVLLILYVMYFSERVLRIFEITGSEPSNLIIAVIGGVVAQLINLAAIKKVKIRNGGINGTTTHNQPSDSASNSSDNDFGLEERI